MNSRYLMSQCRGRYRHILYNRNHEESTKHAKTITSFKTLNLYLYLYLHLFYFQASMVEIYNEQIVDLLSRGGGTLDIKAQGNKIVMPGITEMFVENLQDINDIISMGDDNRHTAATKMNSHRLVVPQRCIKSATKVHQKCHKSALKVPQRCIKSVTKVHKKSNHRSTIGL